MINLYCNQLMLPEPHLVSVPVKDPKTQRPGCEDVALMLPHVIFHNSMLTTLIVLKKFLL